MDSQGLPASGLSAGYGRNIPSHLGRCPIPCIGLCHHPYHPCKPRSAGVCFGMFGIPLVQQIRGQNAVTPCSTMLYHAVLFALSAS
jgi:hypothetical protein